MPGTPDWQRLEWLMHRDPARRGLATYATEVAPLDDGQLAAAAASLAGAAGSVAIVTGFCTLAAESPAAETDGPPGALLLAATLERLGREVALVSDAYGLPLLACGCRAWHLDLPLLECPGVVVAPGHSSRKPTAAGNEPEHRAAPFAERAAARAAAAAWIDGWLDSPFARRLSHVIAIERVGPSHTPDSLTAAVQGGPVPLDDFLDAVPPAHRGACHNARGQVVDDVTAPLHLLVEAAGRRRGVDTIGIGDGGNELGMGRIAWPVICRALGSPQAGRIACRVATDFLLVAGVSDWGGFALALAASAVAGRLDAAAPWDVDAVRTLVERLVAEAGAVDGVTAARQASVDGLPLETYLQILAGLRETVGLPARLASSAQ